jgi:sugar phosphate isomerase/epimerase
MLLAAVFAAHPCYYRAKTIPCRGVWLIRKSLDLPADSGSIHFMPTAKSSSMVIASVVLWLMFLQSVGAQSAATKPSINIDHAALGKLHWQLACQASTFGGITFFDMVDQLHELGVHHITLSPGQELSADFPGVKISQKMTDEQIAALQGKLKSVGMDVVSYGVVTVGDNVDQNRAIFGFARKLKAKNIIVILTSVSLESLDKLAGESSVHVAILTQFDVGWSCQTFMQLVQGRSNSIGFCLDVAALRRTGMPIEDCVQTMHERIMEINLTDITDQDKESVQSVLNQLKLQKFRGIFEIQSSISKMAERERHFVSAANTFSAGVSKVGGA